MGSLKGRRGEAPLVLGTSTPTRWASSSTASMKSRRAYSMRKEMAVPFAWQPKQW